MGLSIGDYFDGCSRISGNYVMQGLHTTLSEQDLAIPLLKLTLVSFVRLILVP